MDDLISRQAVDEYISHLLSDYLYDEERERLEEFSAWLWDELPSVQPKPKTGYISIADVMSVFDDFMCGEVDEDGTETFLEMLKDKAESEGK